MSDSEEPMSKVPKLGMNADFLEESLEEGQEEWLTEDVLTDDDQLEKANSKEEQDTTEYILGNTDIKDEALNDSTIGKSDIERTLTSLESEIPTEPATMLVKEEMTIAKMEDENATDAETDDGNDTDELLRMLQDDGKNKISKPTLKTRQAVNEEEKEVSTDEFKSKGTIQDDGKSRTKKTNLKTRPLVKEKGKDDSTDDEYVLEGAKVTRVMAPNVVKKYAQPKKAEPEDTDSDESEEETMKRMFTNRNVASKSTTITDKQKDAIQSYIQKREMKNKTEQKVNTHKSTMRSNAPKSKPNILSKPNISFKNSPKLSPATNPTFKVSAGPNSSPKTSPIPKLNNPVFKARTSALTKPSSVKKDAFDDLLDAQEFVEDKEDYGLDDNLGSDPNESRKARSHKRKQPIRVPEKMDEEQLTDGDSSSNDDDSLFDDLPTSDSDEIDDWFTLDIRTERASEYLPILGSNAHKILSDEKRRVGVRLEELRMTVAALTDSAKQQAEEIREASNTLVELEAMIKAT